MTARRAPLAPQVPLVLPAQPDLRVLLALPARLVRLALLAQLAPPGLRARQGLPALRARRDRASIGKGRGTLQHRMCNTMASSISVRRGSPMRPTLTRHPALTQNGICGFKKALQVPLARPGLLVRQALSAQLGQLAQQGQRVLTGLQAQPARPAPPGLRARRERQALLALSVLRDRLVQLARQAL